MKNTIQICPKCAAEYAVNNITFKSIYHYFHIVYGVNYRGVTHKLFAEHQILLQGYTGLWPTDDYVKAFKDYGLYFCVIDPEADQLISYQKVDHHHVWAQSQTPVLNNSTVGTLISSTNHLKNQVLVAVMIPPVEDNTTGFVDLLRILVNHQMYVSIFYATKE